ncbi:MAG TPA: hypothetical protein VG326_19870 [Tepidisphaeraceae bacterium]|jgi:hypothetical protein|nr:hypothetical protein [Tepidisphaeraceae bacterium]
MTGGSKLEWPSGLKHTATRDRWFEKFSRLRPEMNLQTIAAELKEAYASVYRWADLFNYSFPDLRREGRVSSDDWDSVDWCKRDAEIARSLNISRERVRQVRAARGIGPSAQRALVHRFSKWVMGNREKLHGLPVYEVLKMFDCNLSQQVARRILRAHDVRPHDPASRWRGIDWRLPNRDLARIWGTSAKYIANIRARLSVGPAEWDAKSSKIGESLQYQQSLAQEMIKSRVMRKAPRPSKNTLAAAL